MGFDKEEMEEDMKDGGADEGQEGGHSEKPTLKKKSANTFQGSKPFTGKKAGLKNKSLKKAKNIADIRKAYQRMVSGQSNDHGETDQDGEGQEQA